MSATVISKIGLPVVVSVLSGILRAINSPAAKAAADSLDNVGDAMKTGGISFEQIAEANRHAEKIAELEISQYQGEIAEVNETTRADNASTDPYVRRMRPTFGYAMAFTWAAQMLGLAYIMVFETEKAGFVIQAMASLSGIWAFGLSVLGIYVYKRSEEKKFTPGDSIYWSKPRN